MLPRSELTKIIRPRLEETFEMIEARVASSGMAHLAGRRGVDRRCVAAFRRAGIGANNT